MKSLRGKKILQKNVEKLIISNKKGDQFDPLFVSKFVLENKYYLTIATDLLSNKKKKRMIIS